MDHYLHRAKLARSLCSIDTDVDTIGNLDSFIIKVIEVLDTCARASALRGGERIGKRKLKIWTPKIEEAVAAKKKTFFEWKLAGRPNDQNG